MTDDAQTSAMETFGGSFTRQDALPEAAIEAALHVLRHGRLNRYAAAPGEISETALLEEDVARLTGAAFCLAVTSGGAALEIALRAVGVEPGDPVLTNGLAPSGPVAAIAGIGAVPVLVEAEETLTLDLDDLAAKLPGARALLVCHAFGHVCDMDRLMRLCDAAGVPVIEECTRSMGARIRGVPSGRHGRMACFSTRTGTHANSGEGGLILSDDAEAMARAVLLSGSGPHHSSHRAAPAPEVFEDLTFTHPARSCRMDSLRAAILRPQLATLDGRVDHWSRLYAAVEAGLRDTPGLKLIARQGEGHFVGSSLQFGLPEWPALRIQVLLAHVAHRGVDLTWLGAPEAGDLACRGHWHFVDPAQLPRTDAILASLIHLDLPPHFTEDDGHQIARILRDEVGRACPTRA